MRSERELQEGSALLIAIFAIVLLSGMGLALLSMTGNEARSGRADVRGKESFYLAEAGLEHGRLALYAANGKESFDDDLLAASGGVDGNTKIDFEPAALQPMYNKSGRLIGFSAGVGDDNPLIGVTSFGVGSYAAFLTNDPIDPSDTDDQNGRVMLTGVGAGTNGSFEIVQAIVEVGALLPSPPPASITLLGPSPSFTPGSSNAKVYDGNDCTGAFFVPTIGTMGSAARDNVRAAKGKPTYQAGGLPANETIADLTDVGEPAVTSLVGSDWTDCSSLRDTIERIRPVADVVCGQAAPCKEPPSAPDRVIFVDGDYDLNSGAGTIVITGELKFAGNVSWSGIILAVGEGVLKRSGGGNGLLSGGMVVADIAGPDNVYGTADDCTGGDGGFDSAQFLTSGGGASTVQYCSSTINAATPARPYAVVEFLQR